MIFEIGSSILMAGVAGFAYLKSNGPATNDTEKIQRIFNSSGWVGKEGETIRLHRKRKFDCGTEYVFQIPLGFDRKKIENNKHILEDGLNIKQIHFDFDPRKLLTIKWDKTALKQIKSILKDKQITRKEVDITFDGMLKVRVYNQPLTEKLEWNDKFIRYNGWCIPVGQTRTEFIHHDFKKSPHMIVAGGTGFGKSQFLKMLITSLILMQPENVHFSLIDLKGGTAFQRFRDLKQVEYYGKNPKEAKEILTKVQKDMEILLEKIVNDGYEDIDEAGIKSRHFIIVDESADMAGDSTCMDIVADIARRGRGAGYHLIYCTQYPTNETIPSQVRPNIGSRICFKLKTNVQSRAVLDEGGAEELPEIAGRGIYQLNSNIVFQAPYMTNKDIKDRIEPFINIRPRKDDSENESPTTSKTKSDRAYSLELKKV